MILASQTGVQELRQGDWFCFDCHDVMTTLRSEDFESIFAVSKDSDNQEYSQRHPVLTKKMEIDFFTYYETMCFKGRAGDYLIQDTVRPHVQWICLQDDFETNFTMETPCLYSDLSSDSIDVDNMGQDQSSLRYSVWGPDIKSRRIEQNDMSSQGDNSVDATTAEARVECVLDDSNSKLYRQHSASLLAFKVHRSCSLWKKHSGQGGRSHGQSGDTSALWGN
jgi:hypothetical protein